MAEFDFSRIDPLQRYKLLTALVVPRPIAWVTSLNRSGSINAAPFSFFNVMGAEPPIVMISIGDHSDRPKDTAQNIEREKEFVVNMVARSSAQSMSDSAAEFPNEVSEVDALGLVSIPSTAVRTPRLAESPASLECQLNQILRIGKNRIVIGQVLFVHVQDDLVLDHAQCLIDSQGLTLIGRMGGLDGYSLTDHFLKVERKKYPPR